MCAVSMVGDHYRDMWTQPVSPMYPYTGGNPAFPTQWPGVSQDEFNRLKKDVEDMKQLLLKAAEYDKRTGQPNCEMEDKIAILKKVAENFGVELSDVFDKINRYLVSDEDGPLRAFNTRSEALFFLTEGMTLTVLPKPPKVDLWALLGDAPF